MTSSACVPSSRAAQAVAMAWLPALTAVTPRARASGARLSITDKAPRGLNEPVCWNSSSLRLTLVPAAQTGAQLGAVPVEHRRAHDAAGELRRRRPDLGQRGHVDWHHSSRPRRLAAAGRVDASGGFFAPCSQPVQRRADRTMRSYLAETALLPQGWAEQVVIEVEPSGNIATIGIGAAAPDAERDPGHRAARHDRPAQPCLPTGDGGFDATARRRHGELLELAGRDVPLSRARSRPRTQRASRPSSTSSCSRAATRRWPSSTTCTTRPTAAPMTIRRRCRSRSTRPRWRPASP